MFSSSIFNCKEGSSGSKLKSDRKIVLPADFLTDNEGIMKGFNTYNDGNKIFASVMGYAEQIDKLLCVNPIKSKYIPSVGDVVVGRVLEVAYKKWVVDIGTKQNAILLLCSVMLPGGEQRKKTHEDVIKMSEFLIENDLIIAEVQSIHMDGTASLHMRSNKYGKVPVGVIVKVHHSLCQKSKKILNDILKNTVVLPSNGWVWIGPYQSSKIDFSFLKYKNSKTDFAEFELNSIARIRNLIELLASQLLPIDKNSIETAIKVSESYQVHQFLNKEISKTILEKVTESLKFL